MSNLKNLAFIVFDVNERKREREEKEKNETLMSS
jgi:hypothetical protein